MEVQEVVRNGYPRQIVAVKEGTEQFDIDLEALKEILLQEDVLDKPVVVISVAGAFRKGKSFLLSFFLKYLQAQGNPNWLGNRDEPLCGFQWAPGRERVTNGIHMWSHPFLTKLPDGTEVAVLLMDTQGTFDRRSTIKEHATVFALSTMMSSVLVYNLMNNIHEYDLEHLQLFTDFGKLALEDNEATPFQKLLFLLRDYPDINEFGEEGGNKLLEETLEIHPKQPDELKSLRKVIKSCFNDISCFLMPHPGKKVTSKSQFNGCISDIDADFVESLSVLVPSVLAPENLVIKNISGTNITATEFIYYFSFYFNMFESGKLPAPQTILKGAVTADNLVAMNEAMECYLMRMNSLMDLLSRDPNASTAALEQEHLNSKDQALSVFNNRKKRGTKEDAKSFCSLLEEEIEKKFSIFKQRLESHQKLRHSASIAETSYIQAMKLLYEADELSLNMDKWEEKHKEFCEASIVQFCKDIADLVEVNDLFDVHAESLHQKLEDIFRKLKLQIEEKQDLESAVAEIIQTYKNYMEIKCGLSVLHQQDEILQSYHLSAKDNALQTFSCKSIVHDPMQAVKLRNKLHGEIETTFLKYKDQNQKKGAYQETTTNIIEELKTKLENGCKEFEKDVEGTKEHVSQCRQQFETYALEKFHKHHPTDGTELQVNYEERLKLEFEKACEEFIDRRICNVASTELVEIYRKELADMCGSNDKKVHSEDLYLQYLKSRREALDSFREKTSAVKRNVYDECRRKLEDELVAAFEHYKGLNEGYFKITMADWNLPHVKKWKEEAANFQQEYYDLLQKKHNIYYSRDDHSLLEKHLGYAMFGPPSDLPGGENGRTGYTSNQSNQISQLREEILAQDKRYKITQALKLDFTFVSALIEKEHNTYCVIHVRKPQGTDDDFFEFFDCRIRGYKNWKDFLLCNELPQCFLCFPKNGVYTAVEGKVALDFDLSAACATGRKILSAFDTVAAAAVIGSGTIAIGSAVAVMSPIIIAGGVAAGIGASGYRIVRKTVKQSDRAAHGQSLTDAEGKKNWYDIAGDSLNIVTLGAMQWLNKAKEVGKAVTSFERLVTALSAGSAVVNGLGLITEVVYMSERLVNGEMPTTLDAFQFASRMFFFTNSAIATHLAMRMLECTNFSGTQLQMGYLLPLMSINKLGSILRKSLLSVKDFIINTCQEIVRHLTVLYNESLSFEQFLGETGKYFTELWNEMNKTITTVCKTLGISSLDDITIGGRKILNGGMAQEARKFASIVLGMINEYKAKYISAELNDTDTTQSNKHGSTRVDEVALTNATDQFGKDFLKTCLVTKKSENATNFLNYVQFVRGYVEWNATLQEIEYQRALTAAEKSSSGVDRELFDTNYGIEGNRFQHFCNSTYEKLQKADMDEYYCQLKQVVDRNMENSGACMAVGNEFYKVVDYDDITVHFYHDWILLDETPSEDTWCDMLEEVAGIGKDFKRTITQKSDDDDDDVVVYITMEDKNLDVKCVVIKVCENEGGRISGVLICLHSV